jgi:hypothetical protein
VAEELIDLVTTGSFVPEELLILGTRLEVAESN